ncbi:MAG: TetR/AcrR family transcriptional regulator, partial [Alphaproteobacteria bacterium]|nr:TetR/AcrR family transcriptional regulator [Alphaproteobacteria bacterium]
MAAKDGNGKNAPPAARGSGSDRGAIREELRAFRKDRILYEAAELFYERGYTGTTLDAIAERLEVTKPFIYYYCQ